MNNELLNEIISALVDNLPSFEVVNNIPVDDWSGEILLSEDQHMAITGSAIELRLLLEVLQKEVEKSE